MLGAGAKALTMYKLTCCVAVAVAGLAGHAVAGIINVAGDQPTIQAGIDAAVNGDEVVVAPGTYFETINFLGKAIWLRSSDGPDVTIIDAQGTGTVVTCESGEGRKTVLEGFTITGGGPISIFGGGMLNSSSSPTVTNCTFTGNVARDGGGMQNQDNSNPTVTNCTFDGNTSGGDGGGMNNKGSNPTVTNCTFDGNAAGQRGGGMGNKGSSPTVTNCTFSGNSAHNRGGGMFNRTISSPTVSDCTFDGNAAGKRGGGMFNAFSSPTVINCTFDSNTALAGGGMGNGASSPTVTNCTFFDNNAFFGGGMENLSNSSPTVTNCTFSGNSADTGEGMYNYASSPIVTNSIVWGSTNGEIVNVSGAAPTVSYSDVQGGWPGTGNIDADPLFVDPPNGDFRLSPGSPCIDAADNTAVPVGIVTDLDGNPRFVDDPDTPDTGNGDPPIVDMGAYESQLPCPWDLDGDSNVFVTDLLLLLGDFGSCDGSPADFDGDGCVGVPDLLALIANFGPCPGSECVWDVNGDGFVDNDDLQQVLDNFGPCDGCPEDVNGDGIVNGLDVSAVATHFGSCP